MAASVSGVGARNGNGVRVGKGLIIIHSFLSFFLRGGRSLFLVKFAPRALEGKSQWAATKSTHLSAGSKQFLYVLYFLPFRSVVQKFNFNWQLFKRPTTIFSPEQTLM